MSAIGRLWRRAPAWRLCTAAAVALTALAAMFPPAVPGWLRAGPTRTPDPLSQGAGTARYVPAPPPPVPDYGVAVLPPLGVDRSGIIPFSGRLLPLPRGTWQELVLGRSGGEVPGQALLLARIERGHLTGLLLAAAPAPVADTAAPVAGSAACFTPDALAHQIITTNAARDPTARECWTLAGYDPSKPDEMMRGGFDRLGRMGIPVPDHLLALRYFRGDATGWLTVLVLLPERGAGPAEAAQRLETWMRRFAPVLHKGFEGTLTARDYPPAVARDPDG
jgi:hypothetical protein